ncbi:unnamed protein product [Rotaria sordida]|uniref:Uncharacterized protein n=1 Tax=Rotaria sordida TaxID=392033 RepID=A0A818KGL7_9BILA|nr:unnamed protein product [Rotaria sordida]
MHCITDAEILLSIPTGKYKERILKQFISRYFEVTTTEVLPSQIFDNIEEQRNELIKELIRQNNNQYFLLWKILLKITKGKILNINLIIDDLHHILPLVNFDTLLINQQNTKETDLKQTYSNETEIFSRKYSITCNEQQNDLLKSLIKNQFYTTEKQINTDEQCEFQTGERFRPLTDNELEQELRRLYTKFEQKTIETILGKSFDASIIPHQTNISTFIGNRLSHSKTNQTLISNEYSKLNTIETFTLDIINSARDIFEIDCFISNIMNESLNLIQTNPLLKSIKSNSSSSSSSSSSSISDDILITNSSSIITYPEIITNDINTNAFISLNSSEINFITLKKIPSLIGSYFINSPIITNDNFISQIEHTFINNSIDSLDNFQLSNIIKLNKSSMINIKHIDKQENFFHETIQITHEDKCNEIKNFIIEKKFSYFQNNNEQKQLIKFIQNEINNYQWPLHEYIGIQGQRSWHALKLAIDISNFDNEFILNYHNDFDWISIDNNYGSFNQRTYLIIRNFQQRIEKIKSIQSYR